MNIFVEKNHGDISTQLLFFLPKYGNIRFNTTEIIILGIFAF
jgi:hypothetical protein